MKEDLEYHLGDPGNSLEEIKQKETKECLSKKCLIIINIISVIIIIVLVIALIVNNNSKDTDDDTEKNKNINYKYIIFNDINYAENNVIKNSFKIKGDNYKEDLGNINEGADYEANELNKYDLYIPKEIIKRKTKNNRIYLYIHGGAWIEGQKFEVYQIMPYIDSNFIIASMDYTLLLEETYKQYNIFRIVDEITATIKNIKQLLKNEGFNENNLELVLSGVSAGGHLSMLYGYLMGNKASYIPIKYIVNYVGPLTLDPDKFLTIKSENDTLENIEPKDIDEAFRKDRLVLMNGTYNNVLIDNLYLVFFMNLWLGKEKNYKINEVFIDIGRKEINKASEYYRFLLDKTKYGNPTTYVNENSIPTLCIYGGKDTMDGVAQYKELKNSFNKFNNTKISLVYFRYGGHNVLNDNTKDGILAKKKLNEELSNFIKNYLKPLS